MYAGWRHRTTALHVCWTMVQTVDLRRPKGWAIVLYLKFLLDNKECLQFVSQERQMLSNVSIWAQFPASVANINTRRFHRDILKFSFQSCGVKRPSTIYSHQWFDLYHQISRCLQRLQLQSNATSYFGYIHICLSEEDKSTSTFVIRETIYSSRSRSRNGTSTHHNLVRSREHCLQPSLLFVRTRHFDLDCWTTADKTDARALWRSIVVQLASITTGYTRWLATVVCSVNGGLHGILVLAGAVQLCTLQLTR